MSVKPAKISGETAVRSLMRGVHASITLGMAPGP